MNEITNSNLQSRSSQIISRLGALAYERREHELRLDVIDAEVSQMEAQRMLIEATMKDLQVDKADEEGRLEKERANAEEERQKAAAEKRKRAEAKKTSRKGKAGTATRSGGKAQ